MALARATRSEMQVLHEELLAVPEIQQVFVRNTKASLDVLIALQHHDVALERKLAEIQGELTDALPGLNIDFDIVMLQGRPLSDVVTPKGFQLFAR
jgi:hypothetical protein